MTTEGRLAKLEAALTPTGHVRRWLNDAHRYDDFDNYTRNLYAAGPDLLPLDRLVREARAHAEHEWPGRPRDERDRTVRMAIGQTILLFRLILRTIVLAEEALEREELVQVGLAAHLALVTAEDDRMHRSVSPSHTDWLATLRGATIGRAEELRALETARTRVEGRYFDRCQLLFPATLRRWTAQRERTEGLAALAVRLAKLDGIPPPVPGDPGVFEARVSAFVADHTEPARSEALDELGDGR